MTLATGQQLQQGRYVIRQRLGQGGMGTVYLAEDRNLDGQLVAIKENLDPSADTQTQFRLTALMLARLSHPNLPRVTDHFIDSNGYQYLVMDYIAGQDLNQILGQHGPLQEDVALAWIEQVMAALDYLHNWVNPTTGKGTPIIHRDIKPSNIKVTPTGQVVLVDFGLAKQEGEEGTLIGARGVTPGYSPVEQYTGGTDIRSDVYALGATLYTLLTGRKPPDAPQIAANATLTPPRRINSKIRASTERAILRAMSTQASERFQSTADFRTALRTKVTLPLASDFAIGSGGRNRPFAQRRNQYIVMTGIVVVSLMLVANLVLSRQGALLPRTEAATTVASPTDADGTALAVVDSVGGEPSPTATPLSTATTPPEATPATTAVNTAPSPTLIASPTATSQSADVAAAANGAPSATPSATFSATPFATATLVNTPTFAPTASATTTSTPTATQPATPSATATPMPATATVTAFPTPTATATPVPSATARPTATGTATAIATATLPPTSTPQPSRTATATATASVTATATPLPTATAVPTATPLPTATAVPTPLPLPTATPLPQPTNTRAPVPTATPAPAAGSNFTNYSVTLLEPGEGDTLNSRRRFAWQPNFTLPAGYYFEPVFWREGGTALANGAGYGGSTTNTSIELQPDQFFHGPGDYYWGILLVKLEPAYTREAYLGGQRRVRVEGGSSGGGGGGGGPAPEPTSRGD